jgi:hypothetical protein
MSVFSEHITDKTPLEKFYDFIKSYLEENFYCVYEKSSYNLSWTATEFNAMVNGHINSIAELGESQKIKDMFKAHKIYQPWVHLTFHTRYDRHPGESKYYIEVTLYYGDDPTIYVHDKAKIFLHMNFDIHQKPVL